MSNDFLRRRLAELADSVYLENVRRLAVGTQDAFGVRIPQLKALARELGKDHERALEWWSEPEHEFKLLAILTAEGKRMREVEMEEWVRDFYSWDLVDQACSALFVRSPLAFEKAFEWAEREAEFEKRAGFVLMTAIAIHHKQVPDAELLEFIPVIQRHADDKRNFVKKAINWLLRTLGKRSLYLNEIAVGEARRLMERPEKSAQWIGKDAFRELTSDKVQIRIRQKKG